jgi:hypothetical protein
VNLLCDTFFPAPENHEWWKGFSAKDLPFSLSLFFVSADVYHLSHCSDSSFANALPIDARHLFPASEKRAVDRTLIFGAHRSPSGLGSDHGLHACHSILGMLAAGLKN